MRGVRRSITVAKYDSIIFDLDGTLWNASKASTSGWNAALKSYGLHDIVISEQDMESVTGRPFLDCAKMLLPDVLITENEELVEAINSNEKIAVESEGGIAYEGVIDRVETLAKIYPLFLVSNCQDWYLNAFWNLIPIGDFFRSSNCYGRSRISKAEMIGDIVDEFGLCKSIYIGDTEGDKQASELAGIDFGYVAYGFGKVEDPTLKFRTFGELVDWFTNSSAA